MNNLPGEHDRSFDRLYQRWHPVVRRAAMAILDDADAADDVAHEVFRKLLEGKTGEAIDAPARYFRSAGRKEALYALRNGQRLRPLGDARLDERPALEPRPDEFAAHEQFNRTLEAYLERLPPRCGRVMTLKLIEGLSHAQVAARLGFSLRAADKQAARGRKYLRPYLERDASGGLIWVPPLVDGGG